MSQRDLTLKPATVIDRNTLWCLLQTYLDEIAPSYNLARQADVYPHPWFNAYFENAADRHPFLIETEPGQPAGLILVEDCSTRDTQANHRLAEFFVMPSFRGQGLAQRAATEVFTLLPGAWELDYSRRYKPAIALWESLLARHIIRSENLGIDET